MNHTVLAFIQSDNLAYLGITILWKQGTEAAPAAEVAPAKLGRKVIAQNNVARVYKLIVLLKDNIVPTYKEATTIF